MLPEVEKLASKRNSLFLAYLGAIGTSISFFVMGILFWWDWWWEGSSPFTYETIATINIVFLSIQACLVCLIFYKPTFTHAVIIRKVLMMLEVTGVILVNISVVMDYIMIWITWYAWDYDGSFLLVGLLDLLLRILRMKLFNKWVPALGLVKSGKQSIQIFQRAYSNRSKVGLSELISDFGWPANDLVNAHRIMRALSLGGGLPGYFDEDKREYIPKIASMGIQVGRNTLLGMIQLEGKINIPVAAEVLARDLHEVKGFIYQLAGEGTIEGKIDGDTFEITSDIGEFIALLNESFEEWERS
ncbi:MAG: hypothetical protein ACTSU5_02130 [Promethearchaeota archaeon]